MSGLRRSLALLAALAPLWALAGPAAAQKPRVAVLRVEFEGRIPEVSRVFLSQRLVEGLAGAGFEVTAGEVLKNALRGGPPPESCRAEPCYRQISERLALDYLVVASVQIRQKNYDLRLELVRGRDGRSRGEERERCELCGIQEVGQKLDKLAASLTAHVDAAAAPPARLSVQSRPPGAAVTIDGREAGTTPLQVQIAAGTHEIVVKIPGHASAQKQITLEPGVSEIVSVALVPLGNPDGAPGVAAGPGPAAPGPPWRLLGLSTLGVGVAALVAGAIAMAADGKRVDCPDGTPPDSECKRNTRLAAGALLGGGGVSLALGGLVLYLTF